MQASKVFLPRAWSLRSRANVRFLSTGRLTTACKHHCRGAAIVMRSMQILPPCICWCAATAPQEAQVIPTLILGHEYQWTQHTNTVLQGYVSKSTYTSQKTDLDELNGPKYQLTLGVRHMRGNFLYTFGVTENLQNVNNTPDIGFQLGFAFIPQLIRQP